MDRFSIYEPAPGFNCDRNEDGSPCYETFSSPDTAEDDYDVVELTPAMLAAMAVEDEPPACIARYQIIDQAQGTLGEMVDALKAHEQVCSRCGCTRKDVASDRLWLHTPAAACCEVA